MNPSAQVPSPLSLLLELGRVFHSTLEVDPLLVSILEHVCAASGSEAASVWLLDADRAWLRCTHSVGPHLVALSGAQLAAQAMLAHPALRSGEPIRIDVVGADADADRCLHPVLQASARCVVVAPLVARGDWLGAITVANKQADAHFTDADRELVGALAAQAAVALQNAQLFEQQRRAAERQALLDQISRHLQSTLNIDTLIPLILQEVNTAIQADAQSLWMLNPATGRLECRFATGPGGEAIKRVTVPMGQGIVGTSVAERQAIIIPDAQRDPRTYRPADEQTGYITRSLLCVPLVLHGQAFGAIEAVNKRNDQRFGPDDLELLRSIANSASLAIENARLFAELAASYDRTLEALAAALDLRDRETVGHSRRVVAYTCRLAQAIGLDEDAIREISRGALIHDIGKIGVPDAVLLAKPGALDAEERRIIERHPREGYEMLKDIPYLSEEIEIVLAHQERWDGQGYPLGLQGKAIPLGARLFAVADAFDALTSDRPYRQAGTMESARAVIAAEAGRQFDPQVVSAFMAVPVEEWERMRATVEAEATARRAQQEARAANGR